jgi:hypothetical protein
MRDSIVDDLVQKYWAGLMNGDRLDVRIDRFEKMLPDVIAEARALCAFAELVAKEATATAVRAAAAKLDDVARTARGETRSPTGIVLKTSGAHLDAVTRKVQAHNLATEAERLRGTIATAEQDLAKAKSELVRAVLPRRRRSARGSSPTSTSRRTSSKRGTGICSRPRSSCRNCGECRCPRKLATHQVAVTPATAHDAGRDSGRDLVCRPHLPRKLARASTWNESGHRRSSPRRSRSTSRRRNRCCPVWGRSRSSTSTSGRGTR